MASDNPLFYAWDLTSWLHKPVSDEDADMVERVVWGWLSPALGLAERPNPTGDRIFSWAIELGGIAYENPAGLSSKQMGPFADQYSSERRAEILAEATNGGQRVPRPRGTFPRPSVFPC